MITTPTAADLQALWTPIPAIVTPADVGTAEPITTPDPAPITLPRCWHRDRSGWIDTPARTRPGWIRTTCSGCGGFVGYRLANGKTK